MDELERLSQEYDQLERLSNEYDSIEKSKGTPFHKLAEWVNSRPALDKAIGTAADIAQYPGAVAAGAVQEVGDVGASLGNLIGKPINYALGTDYKIPHPNLREQFDQGMGLDLAFGGGQLGAALAGGLGAGGLTGATQLASRLPRLSGKAGLLSDIMYGGAGGYALGENSEGDRTLGAVLGAGAQPLQSISNRGLSERILRDREKEISKHAGQYEDIFGAAEKAGVKSDLEGLDWESIDTLLTKNKAPQDFRKSIIEFIKDSSLRNLQNLQSEMGKYERAIGRDARAKTNSLPNATQSRRDAAKNIQKTGQEAVQSTLRKGGLEKEALDYPKTNQSYKENVVPYFTGSLEDVIKGRKFPEKLADRLLKDEQFMLQMGKKYPELKYGALGEKLAPYLKGGAGALAAYIGIPKLLNAKEPVKKGKKKEPFLETGNYKVYD